MSILRFLMSSTGAPTGADLVLTDPAAAAFSSLVGIALFGSDISFTFSSERAMRSTASGGFIVPVSRFSIDAERTMSS